MNFHVATIVMENVTHATLLFLSDAAIDWKVVMDRFSSLYCRLSDMNAASQGFFNTHRNATYPSVSICKPVEISASETSTKKVTWISIHGRDTGMKIKPVCKKNGTVCGLLETESICWCCLWIVCCWIYLDAIKNIFYFIEFLVFWLFFVFYLDSYLF